jgi:hypothetical protein
MFPPNVSPKLQYGLYGLKLLSSESEIVNGIFRKYTHMKAKRTISSGLFDVK